MIVYSSIGLLAIAFMQSMASMLHYTTATVNWLACYRDREALLLPVMLMAGDCMWLEVKMTTMDTLYTPTTCLFTSSYFSFIEKEKGNGESGITQETTGMLWIEVDLIPNQHNHTIT